MFGNFIYFIVVLLIYATYQPSETTNFTAGETTVLFVTLFLLFCGFTWLLFYRLNKRIDREHNPRLDDIFTTIQSRLSVMAIIFFIADIYGLNITDFLSRISLLEALPTIQAAICLVVFIGYLSIVWGIAYSTYRRLHSTRLDRRSYVLSNISFAVPVLMPWLFLSGIADIIHSLPFEFAKRFLSSTVGELLYFLVFLTVIALIGPALIQKFWRCKPLPPGPARDRIESVCRKATVSYRNIVQWPLFGGQMITAGVMGLVKRFRYILVTPALLQYLSNEELDAVIAHEIGHVKKKHLLFYLFFFTGYLLIAYATFDILVYFILYSKPAYLFVTHTGYNQATLTPVLFSIVMIVFFLVYFRYIFGYFMRNFERQADAYAFTMFDTAAPLVSTFRKIAYTSGQSADKPNWHHFSISERIGFLQQCERDRSLVHRHNRKVSRSILVFLSGLLIIGVIGYQLNFGNTGEKISSHFLEEILHRELQKTGDNAQLLSILGDIYYSRNDFEKTVDAYERALSIKFDMPHVLNNLAWLYVTCEDSRYRNPGRGLMLAQRAATLEPSSETLDTLAESYYLNGDYKKAVEAENRALSMAGKNRPYYEDQIKKFMAAVDGP